MSIFCESCGERDAVAETVEMTGIGVGVWMCQPCLRLNAWPYTIVAAQQAILGLGVGNRAWQELVSDTLKAHGVDRDRFERDVYWMCRDLNGEE